MSGGSGSGSSSSGSGSDSGSQNDINNDKVVFLFARQGSAQFLYCGRCKVVEVELPSSRSSLVKLTFELIDFEPTMIDNIEFENNSIIDNISINNEISSDKFEDENEDGNKKESKNDKKSFSKIQGLRSSAFFTELVSTHREEMEVLFGAYSRAAVEEKRLQRLVKGSGPYQMSQEN